MAFYLFFLSFFVVTSAHTLEMTVTPVNTSAESIKETAASAVHSSLLKKVLACQKKKKFYIPDDAGADADGCVAGDGVGLCPSGQVVSGQDANGRTVCVSNAVVVGGTCAVNSVVTSVDSTGKVTCSQPVAGGACPAGYYVYGINIDGKPSCRKESSGGGGAGRIVKRGVMGIGYGGTCPKGSTLVQTGTQWGTHGFETKINYVCVTTK